MCEVIESETPAMTHSIHGLRPTRSHHSGHGHAAALIVRHVIASTELTWRNLSPICTGDIDRARTCRRSPSTAIILISVCSVKVTANGEVQHLRVWIASGLLPLNLLSAGLVAIVVLFPSDIPRIALGIPFLLFFPGYAIVLALFPRRQQISGIERVGLSLGMSVAVVPLIGLILNSTPWGIRLEPVLYATATFTLVTSGIGWFRQRGLIKEERFTIESRLTLSWWGGSVRNKALSIILAVAIIAALGILSYALVTPRQGEKFTEFFVIGTGEMALDYPSELRVNQEAEVIVGIINHEGEATSYRVEVKIGGNRNSGIDGIVVEPDEEWQDEVSFAPTMSGNNQKVEFVLYQNGERESRLKPLVLWINVGQ